MKKVFFGTWLIYCLTGTTLLTGCTAQKDAYFNAGNFDRFSSAMISEKGAESVASDKNSRIKDADLVRARFHNRRLFYAILNDELFEIGYTRNDYSEIRIKRVKNRKELYRLVDTLAAIKKKLLQEQQTRLVSFIQAFSIAELGNVSDQYSLIDIIRSNTKHDQRERGCFIKISERGVKYKIEIENAITVGNQNEIKFLFPLVDGMITRTNSKKELIIATLHSHNHDHGLSGMNKDDIANEKGDLANVQLTEVPWITVGPDSIHGGYVDNFGYLKTEKVTTDNILLYALSRSAKKIG